MKEKKKPKKVSWAKLVRRYPRRNIAVKNYADLEVPDDDHFFCKLITSPKSYMLLKLLSNNLNFVHSNISHMIHKLKIKNV